MSQTGVDVPHPSNISIQVPNLSAEYEKRLAQSKRDVLKRPPKRIFHSILGHEGDYQVDIMFMRHKDSAKYKRINKGFTCVLLAVEVPTRFAYAVPMKTKTAKEVIDSFNKIYNAIEENGKFLLNITTDDGTEFKNRAFQALLHERGIGHYVKEPDDRYSLGIIDHLCRTLKEWIADWQMEHESLSWYEALPQVLQKYEGHKIRPLKASPLQLRKYGNHYKSAQKIMRERGEAAKAKCDQFQVGDHVRIRLRPWEQAGELGKCSSKVAKGSERWSHKVYIIRAREANSFSLSDMFGGTPKRTYRHYDLLKVEPSSVDVPGSELRREVAIQSRATRRLRHL